MFMLGYRLLSTKHDIRDPAMPTDPFMERSIEPIIITKVKPSATTSGIASWFMIDTRLSFETKLAPQVIAKTMMSAASTMSGAVLMTCSLTFSFLTFSLNSSMMDIEARSTFLSICLLSCLEIRKA
jgi:hypothetical protein